MEGLQSRWDIPEDRAKLLAQLSAGRPGLALRLFQEPDLLIQRDIWLQDLFRLLSSSYGDRFAYVENLIKDKSKPRALLEVWQTFWRDVMLRTGGCNFDPTNPDVGSDIEQMMDYIGLHQAIKLVQLSQRAIELIDRNVNSRLVLENFMLDLPKENN
jgi:hypothetical protein